MTRAYRSSAKRRRALQECNSPRNSRRAWLQTMSRGPAKPVPSSPSSVVDASCLKKLPQVAEGRRPEATEDSGAGQSPAQPLLVFNE